MQIRIVIQPEIYERVKKSAKENMRTVTGEINYMLKKVYSLEKVFATTAESVPDSEPKPQPQNKPAYEPNELSPEEREAILKTIEQAPDYKKDELRKRFGLKPKIAETTPEEQEGDDGRLW